MVSENGGPSRHQHSAPQELDSQDKVVLQKPFLKELQRTESLVPRRGCSLCQEVQCEEESQEPPPHGGLFETAFSTCLRTVTHHQLLLPVIHQEGCEAEPSLGYTHWALCADAQRESLPGPPEEANLKGGPTSDLWQDLHHFLSVLMRNRKTGKAIFRHMLGNRICELHLNEQIGPRLPLKSQTIEGLKEMLLLGM